MIKSGYRVNEGTKQYFMLAYVVAGYHKSGSSPLSGGLFAEPQIIDPAKVTRSTVENAASVVAMTLTANALITDVPEKNPAPMMPPSLTGRACRTNTDNLISLVLIATGA